MTEQKLTYENLLAGRCPGCGRPIVDIDLEDELVKCRCGFKMTTQEMNERRRELSSPSRNERALNEL